MDEWKITVKKAQNGYICEYPDETSDKTRYIKKIVFEEKYDEDQNTMKDLLLFVKEYFGIFYSKHNKTNLRIDLEEKK